MTFQFPGILDYHWQVVVGALHFHGISGEPSELRGLINWVVGSEHLSKGILTGGPGQLSTRIIGNHTLKKSTVAPSPSEASISKFKMQE